MPGEIPGPLFDRWLSWIKAIAQAAGHKAAEITVPDARDVALMRVASGQAIDFGPFVGLRVLEPWLRRDYRG